MRAVCGCRVPHALPASAGGAVCLLLFLLVLPIDRGRADIAPESGLLVHVQPVSGSCETPITLCGQITRSTTQEGPVEFLIFFMRGIYAWPGYWVCLESVQDELSWPDAWQLLDFEPCGTWYGSLDPDGATHALSLSWDYFDLYGIGDVPGGVLPIARIVMNVVGPGRLSLVGHYPQSSLVLRHDCDCGSSFVTYPAKVYAEAGMRCGHISAHCGYGESLCEPYFYVEELLLSAPYGGTADSTVQYWAGSYNPYILCAVTVDTHAPWCTAWVDSVGFHDARLHVTADAAGLEPGSYETAIELAAGASVSRCLPVVFTVEEQPVATSAMSWGRVKALYR